MPPIPTIFLSFYPFPKFPIPSFLFIQQLQTIQFWQGVRGIWARTCVHNLYLEKWVLAYSTHSLISCCSCLSLSLDLYLGLCLEVYSFCYQLFFADPNDGEAWFDGGESANDDCPDLQLRFIDYWDVLFVFDCSFLWISMGNFFATVQSIISAEIQWGFLPFLSFVCIKLLFEQKPKKSPRNFFLWVPSVRSKHIQSPILGIECVGFGQYNINVTLKSLKNSCSQPHKSNLNTRRWTWETSLKPKSIVIR